MVESWMDRIARPSGSTREEPVGERQATMPHRTGPAWDPYEVWLRQVKEVRDRAPHQYAPAVVDKLQASERSQRDVLTSPASPRWRLRLAALLPRLSG